MSSKTTRHSHLSLWYTTAAVAAVGGGLTCPANEAVAEIIGYTSGLTAGPSATFDDLNGGVWFDFATGTNQTTTFSGAQFRLQWNPTPSPGWTNLIQFTADNPLGQLGANLLFYPAKLAANDPIGPSGNFDGSANSVMSLAGTGAGVKWNALPTTGYLGLRFGSGGNFNYGWAEVSIAANQDPTLLVFAFETIPNTPIPAGVPEPNPLLLLATGAAGLGAYRAWRARRGQRRGSSVPEAGASESVTA